MTNVFNLPMFETIQRASNGGSPLDNRTASETGIEHGTTVLLMPKRQFVAFLKETRRLMLSENVRATEFLQGIDELIAKQDSFVFDVEPGEIYKSES